MSAINRCRPPEQMHWRERPCTPIMRCAGKDSRAPPLCGVLARIPVRLHYAVCWQGFPCTPIMRCAGKDSRAPPLCRLEHTNCRRLAKAHAGSSRVNTADRITARPYNPASPTCGMSSIGNACSVEGVAAPSAARVHVRNVVEIWQPLLLGNDQNQSPPGKKTITTK
jgi:hypothetical protein